MISPVGSPVPGSGLSSVALAVSPAAGNSAVLWVSAFDQNGTNITVPSSVAGAGGAWALTASPSSVGFHSAFYLYLGTGLAAGAGVVNVTGVTGQFYRATFQEFSPLGAVDAVVLAGDTFSSTPSAGPSAATVDAEELVVAGMSESTTGNGGATTQSGYTPVVDDTSAGFPVLRGGYKVTSNAGAQSASWGTLTAADSWQAALVTIKTGALSPTIVTQPLNATVKSGQTASFTVNATTSGGALAYQWQSNRTGAFANVGTNSASYITPSLLAGEVFSVLCTVSDNNGAKVSDFATAWVPAARPARAGLYGRGNGMDLVRAHATWPNSKTAGPIMVNALFGVATSTAANLAGNAAAQASASAGLALLVGLQVAAQAQASASGGLDVQSGVAVNLAGAAQAQASASGAIAKAIALAGDAAAQAGATGQLAVSVLLAGAASGVAGASGTLATTGTVLLAGAAAGQAAASGALAHGVPLAGSAGAQAGAAGALALSISLAGAALVQAGASASLSKASALNGAALASVTATGQIALSVALSGAALAQAGGAGSLSVSVLLGGAAAALAGVSGVLSLAVPLAGAAQALASAAGALNGAQPQMLAGAAQAQALASGGLVLTVLLGGAAAAQAQAAAGLSVSTPVLLSGAAAAQAQAQAGLSVYTSVLLSGAAAAQATAVGTLSTGTLALRPSRRRVACPPLRRRGAAPPFAARRVLAHPLLRSVHA